MSTQPTLLSRSQVLARLGGKSVSWLYSEMAEGRDAPPDTPRPSVGGLD
jgi:hypothetical protein